MFDIIKRNISQFDTAPRIKHSRGFLMRLVPLQTIAVQLFNIGSKRASYHADMLSHHGLPDLAQRMRAWGKEAIALSAAVTAAARAKGRVS